MSSHSVRIRTTVNHLEASRGQFQQQEVAGPRCQKQQAFLTRSFKLETERGLKRCFHCLQPDGAVAIERHWNDVTDGSVTYFEFIAVLGGCHNSYNIVFQKLIHL